MYLCYIDEAGCPGALPSATSAVQPVLVIAGLFVAQANLAAITKEFLQLKRRFNPNLAPATGPWLDIALKEIKGSDLRRDLRSGGRNRRRAVNRFLDGVLKLLEANDAKLTARIYVKQPGAVFNGKAVYTSSVQALCSHFQHFLDAKADSGLMIADSRTPSLNSGVSHSIFTQKFKSTGDAYARILEMPTFGHSENHVVIQITDYLCSAILSPMATSTYCAGHITSVHVDPADDTIRQRYANRIKALCYRFRDGTRIRGGITINDGIGARPPELMFKP